MIKFKNIKTISGERINLEFNSHEDKTISAENLLALPAVIDPHVHFRTPGMEYKEDWRTGSQAAIRGGCTTVFDMPNTLPPTITEELFKAKEALIDKQLNDVNIPLRYELFFGADKQHLAEIPKVNKSAIGIKVFMGCSTGNLVIDDDESLAAVFSLAAKENMLVAVHAEDEHVMQANKKNFHGELDYTAHSKIRNIKAATTAVAKAIELCERYGTKLYILHVSSADEISLIKQAKQTGLPVFAETTPHHLFFDDSAYQTLQGKVVVNPPLRDKKNRETLFAAIHDRIIDTIGSDHAPHTPEEKSRPYGQCPSGMPGIEFVLPLLLNAHHQGLLSLDEVVSLTSRRARDIFGLSQNKDLVIVDLNKTAIIADTKSKCGWSPYEGMSLTGWPVYTVLKDCVYSLS